MLYVPSNQVVQILIAARRQVEDPAKWLCGYTESGQGRTCVAIAIGHHKEAQMVFARANGLDPVHWARENIDFNDTHTHIEVLVALDRAIVLAMS